VDKKAGALPRTDIAVILLCFLQPPFPLLGRFPSLRAATLPSEGLPAACCMPTPPRGHALVAHGVYPALFGRCKVTRVLLSHSCSCALALSMG
jgi:hypothetical protein